MNRRGREGASSWALRGVNRGDGATAATAATVAQCVSSTHASVSDYRPKKTKGETGEVTGQKRTGDGMLPVCANFWSPTSNPPSSSAAPPFTSPAHPRLSLPPPRSALD